MAMTKKRQNLGRGLAALLGEEAEDYASLDKVRQTKTAAIELLHPSSVQPRQEFDADALKALSDSIKQQGILQPLVVRRHPEQVDHFEIIAGERRWRAAQLAKLDEIPVIIKDLSDLAALHIALIENIQREDLNPLEEAQAYKRLLDEFGNTQEAVARAVGKSRSHIANSLRLLNLPSSVQDMVRSGALSAGHARTLINSDYPEILARQIVDRSLSVREAEKASRRLKQEKKPSAETEQKDQDIQALESDLSQALGLKVSIRFTGKKGSITLHYKNLDQFDTILAKLQDEPNSQKKTASAS